MGIIVRVDVRTASSDDKAVVRRLLELNAHDFSEVDGRDLGPHGEYGYPYLDHYWVETDRRRAYVVSVDDRLAGCALVRLGDPHEVAELFVVRKYRRAGVGTVAARAIFERHPGRWSVHELPGNRAALEFWRRAIPAEHSECAADGGTTQTFVIPQRTCSNGGRVVDGIPGVAGIGRVAAR